MASRTAKIFTTGGSQAVRLPAEFRFEGSEVFVRRDPKASDVILSRKPDSWDDLLKLHKTAPSDRGQGRHERDPFENWTE